MSTFEDYLPLLNNYVYKDAYVTWLEPEERQDILNAIQKTVLTDNKVGTPESPYSERVKGGYIDKETGELVLAPITALKMRIAVNDAQRLFEGMPVMPEDESIVRRYPGVSPIGKYCSMDMHFAQRLANVRAAESFRSPEVKEYVNGLLALNDAGGMMQREVTSKMKGQFERLRVVTRASKICGDPDGRDLLYEEAVGLETGKYAEQFELYLQGIEHAVGIKELEESELRKVQEFYHNMLGVDLDLEMHKKGRVTTVIPTEIQVEFENLEDKLFHRAALDPECWTMGKDEILEKLRAGEEGRKFLGLDESEVDNTVFAYACATADRVLDPLFGGIEDTADPQLGISRGDYIIVDGQTVREKILDEYDAGKDVREGESFDDFYERSVRQKTNEYVAAALMAGKRVEAFVPDRCGMIPKEPIQITRTGYEPSLVEKVTLNAWERFFGKHGFYKEKVARAAEYERLEEARSRVRQRNCFKCAQTGLKLEPLRESFFGEDVLKRPAYRYDNTADDIDYTVERTADLSVAICCMASEGYTLDDIFDPTKGVDFKRRIGEETVRRFEAHDHDWITEVIYKGQKALLKEIDDYVQKKPLHIEDERELFTPENRALFAAGEVLFDTVQEIKLSNVGRYRRLALGEIRPEELAGLSNEEIEKRGTAAANQLRSRANTVGIFLRYAAEDLEARFDMMEGRVEPVSAAEKIAKLGRFEGLKRACGETLWGDKSRAPKLVVVEDERARIKLTPKKGKGDGSGFSSFFTVGQAGELAQGLLSDIADPRRNNVADKYAAEPRQIRKFGRDVVEGRMKERFRMEIHENGDGLRALTIGPAPEKSSARKIQQLQNERNAPAAGGRVR